MKLKNYFLLIMLVVFSITTKAQNAVENETNVIISTPTDFYIAAACVGLVMGGIQALSRSTYSKFLPETTDTTSFFSFYDVTEKIGIIIGTFMYGLVAQLTGSMRYSILFLIDFGRTGQNR